MRPVRPNDSSGVLMLCSVAALLLWSALSAVATLVGGRG